MSSTTNFKKSIGTSHPSQRRKGKERNDTNVLPVDYIPGENDVICGRGSRCFNHEGNKRFRDIVKLNLPRYVMTDSKLGKSEIICLVVEQVRSKSMVGGFVKEDLDLGRYCEVSDFNAREKTSQAFRDALSAFHKSANINKSAKNVHESLHYSISLPTIPSHRNLYQSNHKNRNFSGNYRNQEFNALIPSENMTNNFHNFCDDTSSQGQMTFSQKTSGANLNNIGCMFEKESEDKSSLIMTQNKPKIICNYNSRLSDNFFDILKSDAINSNNMVEVTHLSLQRPIQNKNDESLTSSSLSETENFDCNFQSSPIVKSDLGISTSCFPHKLFPPCCNMSGIPKPARTTAQNVVDCIDRNDLFDTILSLTCHADETSKIQYKDEDPILEFYEPIRFIPHEH